MQLKRHCTGSARMVTGGGYAGCKPNGRGQPPIDGGRPLMIPHRHQHEADNGSGPTPARRATQSHRKVLSAAWFVSPAGLNYRRVEPTRGLTPAEDIRSPSGLTCEPRLSIGDTRVVRQLSAVAAEEHSPSAGPLNRRLDIGHIISQRSSSRKCDRIPSHVRTTLRTDAWNVPSPRRSAKRTSPTHRVVDHAALEQSVQRIPIVALPRTIGTTHRQLQQGRDGVVDATSIYLGFGGRHNASLAYRR